MRVHRLTAWPTFLNLETPTGRRTRNRGCSESPGCPASRASTSRSSTSPQVMRLLQSEGPVNWEIAGQVAGYVALDGATSEPPVTAEERDELEELARAAESHVVAETGLDGVLGLRTSAIGPARVGRPAPRVVAPVLEALAVTLRKALDETATTTRPSSRAHPSGGQPVRLRARDGGGLGGRRSVRRAADDARAAAARRAGRARWSATSSQHALGSLRPPAARPTTSRASRSSCPTSPRSKRRGRSTGATCASRSRCTRSSTRPSARCPWVRERLLRAGDRVRLGLRGRPRRVRGAVRRDRPQRPVVVRRHRRAPRSAARRDAVRRARPEILARVQA